MGRCEEKEKVIHFTRLITHSVRYDYKNILMTKKSWKLAVLFVVPWLVFMLIYRAIINNGLALSGIVSIIIAGAVTGIVFAMISSYAARWKYKNIVIDVPVDESIIKEGGAAQKKGKATIPGKLVLTDRRLVFKSHNVSISSEETYALEHIVNATIVNDPLSKGFEISLVNGGVFRFAVDAPNTWIDHLSIKPVSLD
jgi:hypothetical protein